MSTVSAVLEEPGAPAVIPPQDPASVFLKALWGFVRKNLGLAAVIGGAATIMPLMQIFSGWGLPFVQFVDIRDVMFPGFVFALLALALLAVIYVLGSLADLVMTPLALRTRAFLSVAFIIVCSAAWFPSFALPTNVVTAATLIAIAAAGQVLLRSGDYADLEPPILIVCILAVAGTVSALVLTATSLAVAYFTDTGFAGRKWLAAGPELGCQAQLLWYGEKSVILRCEGDAPLADRIRVASRSADLVFVNVRPTGAAEALPSTGTSDSHSSD